MTTFKISTIFFLYFLLLRPISAQSFSSFLHPVADTIYRQSFTPRIHDNQIYVLYATYELGFSGPNNIVYVQQYSFDGPRIASTRIDPILPQVYQVINFQPMLWLDDRLLVSTDRMTLTEAQRAMVFGFDPDGTQVWQHDFVSVDNISTSGILLPSNDVYAFHTYIRSSQNNNSDDLGLSLIDENGQVAWTKYTSLPADQEREYLRVMAGAKTPEKIIALCKYGLLNETISRNQLTAIDTSGNLLEYIDLPLAGEPLLSNQTGSDTFYLTESKRVGTHYYYCLNTYAGSINNLINTACSDAIDATSSESESDMRVDPQGNVYIVGRTVLAGGSIPIGHIAKWSSAGDLLWKKSYRLGAYPQGVSGFDGLDFAPNGKIIISGYANNDYALPFPLRFNWLLTLDENGCYDGNCDDLVILDANIVPTKEIVRPSEIDFQVYPNPASTELKLHCPTAGQIRIFDTQGRTILEKSVALGVLSLPLANYPLGLYFIQFSDGKSATITKKVIIERE